jgi:ribonuclease HII
MKRAVESLSVQPGLVLVDGNRLPQWAYEAQAIVGGDALEPAIGAASILAKVQRDSELEALDGQYPQYGFGRHKGYPTREHLEALKVHGVLDIHRRSFGPVKRLLKID